MVDLLFLYEKGRRKEGQRDINNALFINCTSKRQDNDDEDGGNECKQNWLES